MGRSEMSAESSYSQFLEYERFNKGVMESVESCSILVKAFEQQVSRLRNERRELHIQNPSRHELNYKISELYELMHSYNTRARLLDSYRNTWKIRLN
jgi:hypothetical protein